jgi:hypothetical protein
MVVIEQKEPNQNSECSLKRNWMKWELSLNISLPSLIDALNRILEFNFEVSGFKFALFPKRNLST